MGNVRALLPLCLAAACGAHGTQVAPTGDEPLVARIVQDSEGTVVKEGIRFVLSRPAHVAVFALRPSGSGSGTAYLLYPRRPGEAPAHPAGYGTTGRLLGPLPVENRFVFGPHRFGPAPIGAQEFLLVASERPFDLRRLEAAQYVVRPDTPARLRETDLAAIIVSELLGVSADDDPGVYASWAAHLAPEWGVVLAPRPHYAWQSPIRIVACPDGTETITHRDGTDPCPPRDERPARPAGTDAGAAPAAPSRPAAASERGKAAPRPARPVPAVRPGPSRPEAAPRPSPAPRPAPPTPPRAIDVRPR